MTEAVGAFGSEIGPSDGWGMVRFGDVVISARELAAFIMMYRTYVLKQVGNERTDMAQQHLNYLKEARGYYRDLVEMKKYAGTDPYKGRVPMTPAMKEYIEEAGLNSYGYTAGWTFVFASDVSRLPESVLEYYGVSAEDGKITIIDIERAREEFGYGDDNPFVGVDSIHYMSAATVIHEDNIETVKQNLNNFIDELSENNNLFMSRFRAVINNMNTALEGANTQVDKANDLSRNVWSSW